eukprot:TRINITY_DN30316_c0_g1_i1.p1 TRINITY_DN30316_c0_g1~~TRINITY_DN30316_c0_g1_i1.p1  ORF type:complete len:1317 (+),score=343.74 TRINITY_DN30316_c0_g1_i1:67-4017(+)
MSEDGRLGLGAVDNGLLAIVEQAAGGKGRALTNAQTAGIAGTLQEVCRTLVAAGHSPESRRDNWRAVKRQADAVELAECTLYTDPPGDSIQGFTRVSSVCSEDVDTVGHSEAVRKGDSQVPSFSAPPPLPDGLICGMRIGRMVGRGSVGTVYKAMDGGGTIFAVKVVRLRQPKEAAAVAQEYNVLKMLSHRNIVKVWDFYHSAATCEIVMSYFPQGSLQQQISDFGGLSEASIRRYGLQILEGLAYLHSYDVVHGDVKPLNMLVDATGRVALADFGLCLLPATADADGATPRAAHRPDPGGADKSPRGTVHYMSRSVALRHRPSRDADLWAVGCSLLEMANALTPWKERIEGLTQLIYAFGAEPSLTPLTELLQAPAGGGGRLSESLRELIELCFVNEQTAAPRDESVSPPPPPRRTSQRQTSQASSSTSSLPDRASPPQRRPPRPRPQTKPLPQVPEFGTLPMTCTQLLRHPFLCHSGPITAAVPESTTTVLTAVGGGNVWGDRDGSCSPVASNGVGLQPSTGSSEAHGTPLDPAVPEGAGAACLWAMPSLACSKFPRRDVFPSLSVYEGVARSGGVQVYFSEPVAERYAWLTVESLVGDTSPVDVAAPYAEGCPVVPQDAPARPEPLPPAFSNVGGAAGEGYHRKLRPSYSLLSQLKRVEAAPRRSALLPGVPNCELQVGLEAAAHDDMVFRVSAEAIERTYQLEKVRGVARDEYEDRRYGSPARKEKGAAEGGQPPHPRKVRKMDVDADAPRRRWTAHDVYGAGEFEITGREIAWLHSSTHLTTTQDFDRRFFLSLLCLVRRQVHSAAASRGSFIARDCNSLFSPIHVRGSPPHPAGRQRMRFRRDLSKPTPRAPRHRRGPRPAGAFKVDCVRDAWGVHDDNSWSRASHVFWCAFQSLPLTQLHAQSKGMGEDPGRVVEAAGHLVFSRDELDADDGQEDAESAEAADNEEAEYHKAMICNWAVGAFQAVQDHFEELRWGVEEWVLDVQAASADYGFHSPAAAKGTLGLSVAELCGSVCLSQRGYYFTSGWWDAEAGRHVRGQIIAKTTAPVTFLYATGLDFITPGVRDLELPKYFRRVGDAEPFKAPIVTSQSRAAAHNPLGFLTPRSRSDSAGTEGDAASSPGEPAVEYASFLPLGDRRLQQRLSDVYRTVYANAQHHRVQHLSLVPLNVGSDVAALGPQDRDHVDRLTFAAMFRLLCEEDWGFCVVYVGFGAAGPCRQALAEAALQQLVREDHKPPRCHIIFHSCDPNYLAVELARRRHAAGVVCPTTARSLLLGMAGGAWEQGRYAQYSDEEHLGAHSTACLMHCNVMRK